jgi:uncharacterized phage protein (TIGR02218 family)
MNREQFLTFYNRLAQTRTKYTECVKITRADGTILRFTALDENLLVQEADLQFYTYKSADSFKITALENQSGLAVSNMNIDAIVSDDSITEEALIAGLYDYANVELFIAYWSGMSLGLLPLRTSWIGEVTLKGVQFTADLRGIAQKLQQVFIQTTSLECRFEFAGTKCGLSRPTYTRNVTITGTTSNDTFLANIAAPDQNKFQWGLATWLTGNNAGGQMEIIRNFGQRIQLFLPMPFEINVGDTVALVYGCDKTFTTCREVYENPRRFGGEPFLASSDLLISYPKIVEREREDGSSGKGG